jgi:hypothetical protein
MATPSRGSLAMVMAVLSTGLVLARVGIVVGVAMLLFLVAFLGYFVVPFVFVLLALGILGVSSTLREFVGLQARRQK